MPRTSSTDNSQSFSDVKKDQPPIYMLLWVTVTARPSRIVQFTQHFKLVYKLVVKLLCRRESTQPLKCQATQPMCTSLAILGSQRGPTEPF